MLAVIWSLTTVTHLNIKSSSAGKSWTVQISAQDQQIYVFFFRAMQQSTKQLDNAGSMLTDTSFKSALMAGGWWFYFGTSEWVAVTEEWPPGWQAAQICPGCWSKDAWSSPWPRCGTLGQTAVFSVTEQSTVNHVCPLELKFTASNSSVFCDKTWYKSIQHLSLLVCMKQYCVILTEHKVQWTMISGMHDLEQQWLQRWDKRKNSCNKTKSN